MREKVTEFRGMAPGHPCKVKGLPGAFVFMYAHVSDAQVVDVTLFGGRAGHGLTRCVAPERVVKRRVAS